MGEGLSIVEGCDILILELLKKSEKAEDLRKKVDVGEVKETIKKMLSNSENSEFKYYESLIE